MIKLTAVQMLGVVGESCYAKVAGIALGLLAAAVVTGGAGLLLAGAYTPVLMAFC